MKRPEYVSDEHLEYLDNLRERGKINVTGAGYYLVNKFGLLDSDTVARIIRYWRQNAR